MNELNWEAIRKYIIIHLGEEPFYTSTDDIVIECGIGRKRVHGEKWAQEIIEWAERENNFIVERTYTKQNHNPHVPVDLTFTKKQ
jgi:hypothetical protein